MQLYFALLFLVPFHTICDCEPLGKISEEQYNSYNIIFAGRVVGIKDGRLENVISFKVNTYYKGKQSRDTIKVFTPSSGASCGISPEIGEDWLVFTYYLDTKVKTMLCTRTKRMNSNSLDYEKEELGNDLKFLEAKKDRSLSNNAQ
ncbi:MAG TPA: hypothetical protein VNT20_22925 [Flavisolibacter sp.]|jgi:hypothetical protein|nr:hypothetical protein [Flavisolibacter sp.]